MLFLCRRRITNYLLIFSLFNCVLKILYALRCTLYCQQNTLVFFMDKKRSRAQSQLLTATGSQLMGGYFYFKLVVISLTSDKFVGLPYSTYAM